MTARTYQLSGGVLRPLDLSGPTLDDVSLQLPGGAYTTLRTYQGTRILGLSAHLKRLADSLAMTGCDRPIDEAAIRATLRAIVEREARPAARLRITLPFDSDDAFVTVEAFETYPPEHYTLGVRCRTTARLSREMPKAKLTTFVAQARGAKRNGDVHEWLMVDDDGRILEGVSSNFFAVLGGTLRTAGESVLEGVTRGIVLAQAADVLPIACAPVTLDDLACLSEAFITSSSREVMPVVRIDDVLIGSGRPGPIAQTLLARYRAYLARAIETP